MVHSAAPEPHRERRWFRWTLVCLTCWTYHRRRIHGHTHFDTRADYEQHWRALHAPLQEVTISGA